MNGNPNIHPVMLPRSESRFAAAEDQGRALVDCLDSLFSEKKERPSASTLNWPPVPHRRLERWKYSPVSGFWQTYTAPKVLTCHATGHRPNPVAGLEAYRAVFVNGTFDSEASNLPVATGVRCMLRSQALAAGLLKDSARDEASDWFVALNHRYAVDGLHLEIDSGVQMDRPLLIHHVQHGTGAASFLRHSVHMENGSAARMILWSSASDSSSGLVNTFTGARIGRDASFHLDKVQNEKGRVHHVAFESVDQESCSRFHIHTVTIQGLWVRNDLAIRLIGSGAESFLNGAFLPNGKEFVDNHTTVDHRVAHCTSSENYKGILYGASKGVFNGKVFVRPDAQHTNAFQQNANILANAKASMNAKPELEIYADDVKCSHGCTIGQFDQEALFYARTRGIGLDDAKAMLVHAFIGEVLSGMAVPEVQWEVAHRLSEKHGWERWEEPDNSP